MAGAGPAAGRRKRKGRKTESHPRAALFNVRRKTGRKEKRKEKRKAAGHLLR